ncbi:MAG TPA: hypothetical protein VKT27_14050 [Candidatus Binataceae bacterium]|nr:hypothetical protein [Candidatus Binataceae bacterium]
MRGAAITAAALMALMACAARPPALLAQDDDWQQVPSSGGPNANAGNSASSDSTGGGAAAPADAQGRTACAMVGSLAQELAKMRDAGISEQAQLDSIDRPDGRLYRLTTGNRLPAATAAKLRAGIHNEIAYVYQHRELAPAALSAQARDRCSKP